MTTRQPPRFRGVYTYKDAQGRYSLRFPSDWHTFELEDNLDGVMVSPEPENPQNWFAVWVKPLEHVAVAEDLDDLCESVDQGIAQLAESNVESEANDALSNLLKFERVFTFRDPTTSNLSKRKIWIMYVDRWMMVVTYNAATVEEYQYWLAMMNYSFDTFTIPEALWFATDRDLVGHNRIAE